MQAKTFYHLHLRSYDFLNICGPYCSINKWLKPFTDDDEHNNYDYLIPNQVCIGKPQLPFIKSVQHNK